jgi:mRNA interferase HigB
MRTFSFIFVFRMKVHLIKKQTLLDFAVHHPRSKTSLHDWIGKIKFADWERPDDVKSTFNTADILGNGTNRIVFDIAGNNYRIICKYVFGAKQVHLFVCWIGTHAEYDKICNKGQQFTINIY